MDSFLSLIGPIVTKLADRYGCRLIAIAGSLIASLGFFASVFAPSLYMLYISFGIVSGKWYGCKDRPEIDYCSNNVIPG